ncbi:MAG: hypothetical protein MJ252_02795 [archaeon]|nr:hypothetical protein [archaeon]
MNKFLLIFLLGLISCNLQKVGDIDPTEFNNGELAKHNEHRRKHKDTPDLVLNQTLIKRAQGYAEELCAKNPQGAEFNWKHSNCTLDDGTSIGENLYGCTWTPTGGTAADDWCK